MNTDPHFLETVLDYVHLNPVRAGLISVRKGQSVRDYPWSSIARGYAILPSKRPKWQSCAEGLDAFGWKDIAAGRRKMIAHLDSRAQEEEEKRCGVPELPSERDGRLSELRKGWYWGSQAFCERMLALVGMEYRKTGARGYRSAPEVKEHGAQGAEQLLREALAALQAKEAAIKDWPRDDARKLALAILLRKHTTVPGAWIAKRLSLGSAANVSQRVRTADPDRILKAIPAALRQMVRGLLIFEH